MKKYLLSSLFIFVLTFTFGFGAINVNGDIVNTVNPSYASCRPPTPSYPCLDDSGVLIGRFNTSPSDTSTVTLNISARSTTCVVADSKGGNYGTLTVDANGRLEIPTVPFSITALNLNCAGPTSGRASVNLPVVTAISAIRSTAAAPALAPEEIKMGIRAGFEANGYKPTFLGMLKFAFASQAKKEAAFNTAAARVAAKANANAGAQPVPGGQINFNFRFTPEPNDVVNEVEMDAQPLNLSSNLGPVQGIITSLSSNINDSSGKFAIQSDQQRMFELTVVAGTVVRKVRFMATLANGFITVTQVPGGNANLSFGVSGSQHSKYNVFQDNDNNEIAFLDFSGVISFTAPLPL